MTQKRVIFDKNVLITTVFARFFFARLQRFSIQFYKTDLLIPIQSYFDQQVFLLSLITLVKFNAIKNRFRLRNMDLRENPYFPITGK